MAETAKSFCRNCGALCAMELEIENGRLISAAPDASVSPYGGYMCPKGRAAVDFHNGAENRLMHSLQRQADGSFSKIAATDALDAVAAKLGALIAAHGPRSVAFYHGTGAYRSVLGGFMERALCAAIGTPNFFSTMTIDQSAKWVTNGRLGVMASGKHAFRDVDVALTAGNNPVVSHQTFPFGPGESGAPARSFADAKARGMRFIVVDPRKTETARYADLLIQPLPGHDAALFAAIAHILLRDQTYDHAFITKHAIQLEELRAAVAPFTPEEAARRADVPVEQIELAAKWLGEAKRPMVGSGSGPSMSDHSNLNDHMIEVVNALVGGYRRAGDLVRNPGTLRPKLIREMALSPTRSWEHGPKCRTADIGHIFGEFPTALLPQEILTPGEGRIRALIVFAGDPLKALGDPARALPAFEDLELLVSVDCRMNETGKLSHYVLATSQPFERHDVTVAGDNQFPEAFAQYAPPIVQRPPDTIDDWEVYWGLSSRLRLPLTFKYFVYGADYAAIPGGLELDLDTPPNPEDLIRFLCKDSAVSFDELAANPSGVRPQRAPSYVEAIEDKGGRLNLCPPDVAAELRALANEPQDTNFAFRLTCRRILHAMNGAYVDAAETRKRFPVNYAHMNPGDMRALNIEDGAQLEIASSDGKIAAIAKPEPQLRRGVISMSHMFGRLVDSGDTIADGGANVGQLTSLERWLEPINYMPRFSGIPVNITKA